MKEEVAEGRLRDREDQPLGERVGEEASDEQAGEEGLGEEQRGGVQPGDPPGGGGGGEVLPQDEQPVRAGGGHPVVQGEEAVDLETAAEEPEAAEEAAQDRSQVAPLRP